MRVCGKNVFNELNFKDIRKVFISENFKDKDIMNKIKENKIKYVISDPRVMDKMMPHNQGIIVEINDYDYKTIDSVGDERLVVMLDHLEDPHNFGAIIRTCEAAGVKTIIIPKDRGVVVNDTVMKTSAGALNHVNIVMVTNLVNAMDKLKDKGYFVYSAEADGTLYNKVDYADKVLLVIGSEGNGLSRLVRENSDEIISIPMKGVVNSLAWTTNGGNIQKIECISFPGNGKIITTGNIEKILEESILVAKSYIKYNKYINKNLDELDLHINLLNAGIKKDGSSGGVAIITSILSSLKNKIISESIAMTGEITLNGDILAVGGIKEKIIGAYNNNIKTVYIPYNNKNDLSSIPNNIKENLEIKLVKNYKEIYMELFK